jgi:hypothetical protein
MRRASPTTRARLRDAQAWRRRRARPWARPNDLDTANALLALIPSLPRSALSRLTMQMIDRMDEIDGDPDFEDLREDWEDSHDREIDYEHD